MTTHYPQADTSNFSIRTLLRKLRFPAMFLAAVMAISTASAELVTYVAYNGLSSVWDNWPAGTSYTSNLGIVFKTGSTVSLIDYIDMSFINTAAGSSVGTFTVELRDATSTTPYSAAVGSTMFASDTVTFGKSVPAYSGFGVTLSPDTVPITNISAYSLQPNTAYSLILYNPTARNYAMLGATTTANSANNLYATTDGFTVLNTIYNNATAGTGNRAYSFTFGSTAAPVPEPGTWAGAALLVAGAGIARWRKRRQSA